MKYISVFEPTSKKLVDDFAAKRNLTEYVNEKYTYPQEDHLLTSDDPYVFVVADGVTLNFKKLVEDNREYPNPSPAGEVAKIFCEAVQKSVLSRYDTFEKNDISAVFGEANRKVAEYNNKVGQSEISGNTTGFYSATGSFVVIKDRQAYWASICDAFFAHFDKDMNIKFMSTGLCSPYAVINGEERMPNYIESGVVELEAGDRVCVFTDGFEHYVKNAAFREFFKEWQDDIKNKISAFSERMISEDFEKYGHERSLIAILIS